MGRPRIHKNDAAKAKAYRERVKRGEVVPASAGTPASRAVTRRVLKAQAAADS